MHYEADFPHPPTEENPVPQFTKFYAVDKCIARRDYLRFISLENYLPEQIAENHSLELDLEIEHDLEWLAILKVSDSLYYQGIHAAKKLFNL